MYIETCEALKQKVCGNNCRDRAPFLHNTHKLSLLRRSFSTKISLQNLDKSICIGFGMEGLDGPCHAEIAESVQ